MKRIFLIILFISPAALAQFNAPSEIWSMSHYSKAEVLYKEGFYEEAIIHYRIELEKFNFNQDVLLKLARCYGMLADYKNERNYYLILAQTNALDEPEDIFKYAEALLSVGDYEEAVIWYNNYLRLIPGNQVAIKRLKGAENIGKYLQDSAYASATLLAINSELNDFGAVPFKDGILFSSAREKDLMIRHDNYRQIQSLVDIFYLPPEDESGSSTLERIKMPNYRILNDGPVSVGENIVVVSRNNGKKKDEVYNSLGLQFYSVNGKSFDLINKFPYNNSSYSIMHPALSSNEDTLYFASDMPGGFGGLDIFYSVHNGKTWLKPVNIGSPVNTQADDAFPFVENGKLYFSSNGHEGMGGLDVFVWDQNSTNDQGVENLGYPINSGWDDFSIYLKKNKGYISSNRPGGIGLDDIYAIEILDKPLIELVVKSHLKLRISDLLNDDRIGSAEILLSDKNDGTEYKFLTSPEGEIDQLLDPAFYSIKVIKPGFEIYETQLDLLNTSLRVEDLYIKPILKLDNISLDSILFEYDDFRLSKGAEEELDQIVDIMNKYELIGLEVSAYTDSRGEKEYNHWLSEMRAASTANYLIEKGIPFERITISGYGETRLLNHCEDGVSCSEEEHMVNRRIEFLFTTNKKQEE